MKKFAIVMVVLVMAAPSVADVNFSCEGGTGPDANLVIVTFTNTSGTDDVRAISVDISVSDGNIVDVNCVNGEYTTYPGSVQINDEGEVTDEGSCLCSPSYPGTLGDDANGVTIEMGSLFIGHANAPNQVDEELVRFRIDPLEGTVTVTIDDNVIRGGVVMDDPNQNVTTNLPATCQVSGGEQPHCWDGRCPGQGLGDATCDGNVNIMDVLKVKQSWLQTYPAAGYNGCADFDHNCSVNIMDILKVKQNWLATGLGGDSTLTEPPTCPWP